MIVTDVVGMVAEIASRDTHTTFAPLARELVEALEVWSGPFEVRALERGDGLVELEFRRPTIHYPKVAPF